MHTRRLLSAFWIGAVASTALALLLVVSLPAVGFAPAFSDNVSLNQKALFIRQWNGPCPLAVIGSSNALNNIDSAAIAAASGRRAINTGYWGASMRENLDAYRAVAAICDPDVVVLPLQYLDVYAPGNTGADWAAWRRYESRSGILADVRTVAPRWPQMFGVRRQAGKAWYREPRYYTNLNFDSSGAAMLACEGLDIDPKRWTNYQQQPVRLATEDELEALSELVSTAVRDGARVIVVRPPMRDAAERHLASPVADAFWRTIQDRVAGAGGQWLDAANHGEYPDAMFADFVHLNACGAAKLARAIVAAMGD